MSNFIIPKQGLLENKDKYVCPSNNKLINLDTVSSIIKNVNYKSEETAEIYEYNIVFYLQHGKSGGWWSYKTKEERDEVYEKIIAHIKKIQKDYLII